MNIRPLEDREIEFDIMQEQKAKTRRIAETVIEMINEDYDNEDVTSYIRQHLIEANN